MRTNENANRPIGLFDSGLGGLSIWQEVQALLPAEDKIYFADRKYAPYGRKSKDEIIERSSVLVEQLLDMNCKLIVVACNTATTHAISVLRKKYDVMIVGTEPAIKPAAFASKKQRVGVLATQGTLVSSLFLETKRKFASEVEVINQHGTGLVRLIETGDLNNPDLAALLSDLLKPLIKADIDVLVLGCTHYPFLRPLLLKLLPEHIEVIDSGEAIARRVGYLLKENDILNTAYEAEKNMRFYTNKDEKQVSAFMKYINIPYSCEYMTF